MAQSQRPQLAAPRARAVAETLEAVRSAAGGWDADVYHVLAERDDALLADEIINGVTSEKFVYQFSIQGTDVVGISVIGARHLAYHYGGLKHRIVASVQKNAELFTFTTYPFEGQPMQVSCSAIRELADQPDFYEILVELTDVKTGNSFQTEKREYRFERRSNGSEYDRPHYRTIAASKAFRNAVTTVIPQDVQIRWRNKMVSEKKMVNITGSVIDEKRAGVLRFAAKQGLLIDRRAVEDLTLDQIAGLGDAARSENQAAFVNAARALQLDINLGSGEEEEAQPSQTGQAQGQPQSEGQPAEQKRRGRPPKVAQQPAQQEQQQSAENEPQASGGEQQEPQASGEQQGQDDEAQQPPVDQQQSTPAQQQPAAQQTRPQAPAAPSRGAMLDFC